MAALLAGCAAHVQGLVTPTESGARLTTVEGKEYRLVLLGDATALSRLDGHLVRVEGQRALGRLRVEDWQVIEGRHGMSVWVGRIALMGSQVGVEDRGSGAFYWIDAASGATLRPHFGELVLIEGYVDGPHQVRALYYRLLEADPTRAPEDPNR